MWLEGRHCRVEDEAGKVGKFQTIMHINVCQGVCFFLREMGSH